MEPTDLSLVLDDGAYGEGVCRLSAICQQSVRERPRIGGYGKLEGITKTGQKGALTRTNELHNTGRHPDVTGSSPPSDTNLTDTNVRDGFH